MDTEVTCIKALIAKAAEDHDSDNAMRFAQAALNAAHALSTIALLPKKD